MRSVEDKRRGQVAMRAMFGRMKKPYEPRQAELAEVQATQKGLTERSKLEERAAAWIYEMAGTDTRKADAAVGPGQKKNPVGRTVKIDRRGYRASWFSTTQTARRVSWEMFWQQL